MVLTEWGGGVFRGGDPGISRRGQNIEAATSESRE